MDERTVTDLETTALEAVEFLRRFDEAARADLSTGRGKLGASWDHMEALIAAVRELARQLRDLKGFCKAADEDAKAAEAEAQTLRDALERGAAVAEQYLDTERGDLDGWVEYARAALATPDTQNSAGEVSAVTDPAAEAALAAMSELSAPAEQHRASVDVDELEANALKGIVGDPLPAFLSDLALWEQEAVESVRALASLARRRLATPDTPPGDPEWTFTCPHCGTSLDHSVPDTPPDA